MFIGMFLVLGLCLTLLIGTIAFSQDVQDA